MTDQAGSLLLRAGLVSEALLTHARKLAAREGGTVLEHLVAAGLDEQRLCAFYHERLLVPRLGLEDVVQIAPEVIARVPAAMATEFRVLPVRLTVADRLTVAMADPSNTHAVDELAFLTRTTIHRAVAAPRLVAWALYQYYGVRTPLWASGPPTATLRPQTAPGTNGSNGHGEGARPNDSGVSTAPVRPGMPAPASSSPAPSPNGNVAARAASRPPAMLVEDVYGDDTPIPEPVPFDTTGSLPRIDLGALGPAAHPEPKPVLTSPEAEAALPEVMHALEGAHEREAVSTALVAYLARLCRRSAFFVVKKGALVGWIGQGLGVQLTSLRQAALALDGASTFRDVVATRLPFRGPVTDPTSRDFLIEGLGWAPDDMLAIPVSVRDKVVGVLYADDRQHAIPDEHLAQVARAAGAAFERLLRGAN